MGSADYADVPWIEPPSGIAYNPPEGETHDPDAPSVSLSGAVPRYRPSSLGSCPRALVAARMGYAPKPVDEKSTTIMGEGWLHEPSVLKHLVESEALATLYRPPLVRLDLGFAEIVGTPDGLGLLRDGSPVLVEVKTAGKSAFPSLLSGVSSGWPALMKDHRRYAIQVSAYAAALSESGFPVEGVIFGIKCRDNGQIEWRYLQGLPLDAADITMMIAEIETAAESIDPSDPNWPACVYDPWCRHDYLHDETEEEVRDDSLSEVAEEYATARYWSKKWDARLKAAKTKLTDSTKGIKKLVAGRFRVSWSTPRTFVLDADAIKQNHPEAYATCVTERVVEDFDADAFKDKFPDLADAHQKPARASCMTVRSPRGWKPE